MHAFHKPHALIFVLSFFFAHVCLHPCAETSAWGKWNALLKSNIKRIAFIDVMLQKPASWAMWGVSMGTPHGDESDGRREGMAAKRKGRSVI